MRILTHPAMLALGAATIWLLVLIAPLVSPYHTASYHLIGSPLSIFVPVLIILCLVWFAFAILLWFARKPGWIQTIVWSSLIVLLSLWLLKDWALLTAGAIPHWLQTLGLLSPIIIFLGIVIARRFPAAFDKVHTFVTLLLGFASLSAIIIVCQLLWFTWRARGLNTPQALHQRVATIEHPKKPKIIWLILDELSYQQVYEQRFAGLNLPELDQLARGSTVFTHVVPAGGATEIIVPSIMTGMAADQIQVSADGRQLFLHESLKKHWKLFDSHQTVFQDALDAGYVTGIAGWFNPYCRIMSQVTDSCFWTNHVNFAGGMFPGQSIAWNTAQFAIIHFDNVLSGLGMLTRPRQTLLEDKRFHQLDYNDLNDAADKLLMNRYADFIFLHMPVPHQVGIYDRKNATFTNGSSSYIDNLALADRYLAHLRFILEQQGEWDSSVVIVMGDHSWRTKSLWARTDAWTREDESASHGAQFDDRPAYIVKLPNQHQSVRIDDRFAAIRTRALLDGIMTNRIKTPQDLATWVRQQN